ncbi:hypothetical protein CEQ15_11630 [Chryseobacterium indologenes]|uniref:DUF1281 family ferredoxin-like fold protein n=1 Tax=Chryseobacterium indologenes TaxID=253 RepID=UPI000B516EA5|nr:hypothetical protein [Chryseobacterium indologenes]ASE62095.1 hypothetical protein CEQ15_11630 [Chryseobacterium indologenes]
MANWCNNTVVFLGTPEAIAQITALFQKIVEMGQQIDFDRLPDFLRGTEECFFCYISFNHDGMVKYESKWSPNIEAVLQIAMHYEVDFVMDYQEVGNCIFGRATYAKGIYNNICSDPTEFDRL